MAIFYHANIFRYKDVITGIRNLITLFIIQFIYAFHSKQADM